MSWNKLMVAGGLALLVLVAATPSFAADKQAIDTGVGDTLAKFYALNAGNRQLAEQAAGMLVFPRVTKAGIGIGGEHGEGALRIGDKIVDYYSIAGGSIGATLGVARSSLIIMFTTKDALDKFQASRGWQVGVDANIALVSVGAGGQYDSNTLRKPVVGFVFDQKGLLADVSLEGGKISKLKVE
jgi:lipid-binding SYLF domain-containing protein